MSLDAATQAQITAANPASSTWVSANAGSGKTRVLTSRVARLLLKGTRPERILCLTFTKAAAAEMQGRLFATLGKWAMMPEPELRAELANIGETPPATLDNARTLFASALETPGGLKIQTIHAFCSQILRRFPLEAGVPPNFSEIDDGQAALLRADILDAMARDPDDDTFSGMAAHLGNEAKLDALLKDILKNRDAFGDLNADNIRQTLGIADETIDEANAAAIAQIDMRVLRDVVALIHKSDGSRDKDNTMPLYSLPNDASTAEELEAVRKTLWTGAGDPRKLTGFPAKKSVGDQVEAVRELFAEVQEVISDWSETVFRINLRDRLFALAPFAAAFLSRYDAAKRRSGLVDFDDQVALAADLLNRRNLAPWVLFKLDGGIDHILVDEAQDTSPRQWQVVAALEAEFSSGKTAVDRDRTLFVVGDKKQSIFSFQGADPREFDRRRQFFADRLEGATQELVQTELITSFRSAGPILELVDRAFAGDPDGGLGGEPEHVAIPDKPGRIDLWPFVATQKEANGEPPIDQIEDRLNRANPVRDLARDLADFIADTIGTAAIPTSEGPRTVRPGDVLVLVRSRTPFFHLLIDGLKERNVPVAGADRLKIAQEIAVKDLMSTLKFLNATFDDLSLAEALRSPLFGLSEGELFDLAHGRGKQSMWAQMIATGAHPVTEAMLSDLLGRADYERPYEILERILLYYGGRQRLAARLGTECEDAVDELLSEALRFEKTETPSIGGFVAWMGAREIEVKRDMEAGRNQVRVMTVHGSKGLEAPLVILPDVTRPDFSRAPEIQMVGSLPVWNVTKDARPVLLREVEAERQAAEEREFLRLLYVALTRAESWLIVCGAGQPNKKRWHPRIEAAFEQLAPVPESAGEREILTVRSKTWPVSAQQIPVPQPAPTVVPWLDTAPPPPPAKVDPTNPSKLGGAHALPGLEKTGFAENPEEARKRGSVIHDLLDILPNVPVGTRAAVAERLIPADAPYLAGVLEEAVALIEDPDLADLFAADVLVEVPVFAHVSGQPLEGRIDRLLVAEDRITVIDLKSNQVVPDTAADVPDGILRQMGAYSAALTQIYPNRTIETAILWTRTRQLMTLPHEAVMAAFETATTT